MDAKMIHFAIWWRRSPHTLQRYCIISATVVRQAADDDRQTRASVTNHYFLQIYAIICPPIFFFIAFSCDIKPWLVETINCPFLPFRNSLAYLFNLCAFEWINCGKTSIFVTSYVTSTRRYVLCFFVIVAHFSVSSIFNKLRMLFIVVSTYTGTFTAWATCSLFKVSTNCFAPMAARKREGQ